MLRLAIEILLKELGETGSINDGIQNLVKKGLDVRVQQSLDIVRVTGNNAVHPGEIVFDDTTNVHTLFQLINIIADDKADKKIVQQLLQEKRGGCRRPKLPKPIKVCDAYRCLALLF